MLHGLRRRTSVRVKGLLRRQKEVLFPGRDAREYKLWFARQLPRRESQYTDSIEPGLLSILTPVWDGSPLRYLRILAGRVAAQNREGACEWVVLDNGCTNRTLCNYLNELRANSWIKVPRLESNAGIIGGLRRCLETATGRYIVPVDADDLIYPDALKAISWWIRQTNYPPLLYSDEDKINGTQFVQPYFKPDWDPVLLLNSAYIAHLGIADREKAIQVGAYTDRETEGSPDWDLFVRFHISGYGAVHIPEILYSWRVHADSTADDAATKPYIHLSQEAVLQRFLNSQPSGSKYKVGYNPLFPGSAHFWLSRQADEEKVDITRAVITPDTKPSSLFPLANEAAQRRNLICLSGKDVRVDHYPSESETQMLFEFHPDTVMIGGRIRNRKGIIIEAGRTFGFAGVCGCPDRGRSSLDPGYFGLIWKQRSVSAVSSQFAMIKADFLLDVLANVPAEASMAFLGAWAGAHAARTHKRVIYSPFLSGASETDWDSMVAAGERSLFAKLNRDLIPDRRFYSRHLSLERAYRPAFEPVS